MYLDYYQLSDKPFRLPPDPDFLYLSPMHREAIAALTYSIGKMKGFVSLTGEVGLGKTLVLKTYLKQVDRERIKPLYLFNPDLTFRELVWVMYRELGLKDDAQDTNEAIRLLHKELVKQYIDGLRVVLVVDEAHLMPVDTLERLRILSNLETKRHKLLQIVLCGQPELNELLERHELRQLKQRITVSVDLEPLTRAEGVEYLKHRLARVSRSRVPALDDRALKRIAVHAKGIPRVMNVVADNALITGFAAQKRPVTSRIVGEVIKDMQGKKRPRRNGRAAGKGLYRRSVSSSAPTEAPSQAEAERFLNKMLSEGDSNVEVESHPMSETPSSNGS